MKKSTKLGIISLLLPSFVFLFQINSFFGNAFGFVFYAYWCTGGIIVSNGYFLFEPIHVRILFQFFRLEWYLSPQNIMATSGDIEHAINIFLHDFYGTGEGVETRLSLEAMLFLLSFPIILGSIFLSHYDEESPAMVGFGAAAILHIITFLLYLLKSPATLIPIPLGILTLCAAIYHERKEREQILRLIRSEKRALI